MTAPHLDVPGWEYVGGAAWGVLEGASGDARRPHRYAELRGFLWRWRPGAVATAPWEIKLMHTQDGKQTAARASLGPIAIDDVPYARRRRFDVAPGLHEQQQRATRVWMLKPSAVWIRSFALYAPLEAERVAIRERLDWPLHLALACEQLRGLL